MSRLATVKERQYFRPETEKIKGEIAALEAQITQVEQLHSRAPILLRLVRRWVGLGSANDLAWLRFKLKLKQQDLHANETPANKENLRQKMERMIKENPVALASHIRRAYQPLIEAEEVAAIQSNGA